MDTLAAKIYTFSVPDQHGYSSGVEYDLTKIPRIRGSESFYISVSGLDFSINMILAVDVNGRPTIAICDSVTKQINAVGEKKLASLPVTTKLGRHFLLDYHLLQAPNFRSSYMETFHKGQIFWLGDETDAPFETRIMSDIWDTQKMLYLWITDYMFNTLGYAAQMHNYLLRNITTADLPPDQKGILITTCTSFVCLGNLILQLQKAFPNSTVELNLFSCSPSTMTITPKELKVGCGGNILLYARQKDNSLTYLMSIMATMEIAVNVSIANELVYSKQNDMKFLPEMNLVRHIFYDIATRYHILDMQ